MRIARVWVSTPWPIPAGGGVWHPRAGRQMEAAREQVKPIAPPAVSEAAPSRAIARERCADASGDFSAVPSHCRVDLRSPASAV